MRLTNRVQIGPAGVYTGICIALGLLMVGHTTNQLWSDLDFWVWLGPAAIAARSFSLMPMLMAGPDGALTFLLLFLAMRTPKD